MMNDIMNYGMWESARNFDHVKKSYKSSVCFKVVLRGVCY